MNQSWLRIKFKGVSVDHHLMFHRNMSSSPHRAVKGVGSGPGGLACLYGGNFAHSTNGRPQAKSKSESEKEPANKGDRDLKQEATRKEGKKHACGLSKTKTVESRKWTKIEGNKHTRSSPRLIISDGQRPTPPAFPARLVSTRPERIVCMHNALPTPYIGFLTSGEQFKSVLFMRGDRLCGKEREL